MGVNVSQDSQQKCSNQTGDTESRGKESEEMGAERDIQFDKSDISETQQERFLSMIDQFSVGGARWFSCLDLASDYWQIPVAEASFNGK